MTTEMKINLLLRLQMVKKRKKIRGMYQPLIFLSGDRK